MFTLAGLGGPVFGWMIAGPIMALCALVAVWGFWPVLLETRRFSLVWPMAYVPLHIAARRAYEAVEKAGVVDNALSSTISAEAKLTHFKYLFMIDSKTKVFGVRPPSTRSRLIPKSDLQGHDLYPADGEVSRLDNLFPSGADPAYISVAVRRGDLARVIKEYISEARKIKK